MEFEPIALKEEEVAKIVARERKVNGWVRGLDARLKRWHLGGRKGEYDDVRFEFEGGASEGLRKKHYDKSLRLLWKAEEQIPWSNFRDCSKNEKALLERRHVPKKNIDKFALPVFCLSVITGVVSV